MSKNQIHESLKDLATPINTLKYLDKNARKGDIKAIKRSYEQFGQRKPIVATKDGTVIAGNHQLQSAKELGWDKIAVVFTNDDELTAKAFALADNRTSELGGYDKDFLAEMLSAVESDEEMFKATGFTEKDIAELIEVGTKQHGKLQEVFVVPPFSVLDTRQGYWQDRKKAWANLIKDGETRNSVLADEDSLIGSINDGTSIIDPVLCEAVCKWFGIENGSSFDCFAGDTGFGYVSSYLGHKFTGIELRKEQCDYNNQSMSSAGFTNSKYICDDGQNVSKHIEESSQDFLFSCPPYYDLEVYSDLKNDASNQESYKDFISILNNAFTNAIKCLKEDRFACIVVGDIRDKKGYYYNFISDIKNIFIENGLGLYNELVLVNALGTAPQRASNSMKNRKVVKVHQNILVFYKGDPTNIKNNYPELNITIKEENIAS